MDESDLDKTENATPFKLRKAREKGAVARSLDLGFFAALCGALAFVWISGSNLALTIANSSAEALAAAGTLGGNPQAIDAVTARLVSPLIAPLVTFAASLFAIALLIDFFQVGPVFSATPLKPDFNRINPAKNFKRLFSLRMLIEALKAVLKLAVYSTIVWLSITRVLRDLGPVFVNTATVAAELQAVVERLMMHFAIAALAFALLDQIFVRRDFAKRMRMSRREVRREHREREGEPRLKQKRRQLHNEFAQAVNALRNVRGSDVVLTNPTHYAVALRYDPAAMNAPVVTARGGGELAQRIKRVAFTYGVLTIPDPALARALYQQSRVGEEIPANFYQAVADHYRNNNLRRKSA